jgi:hypothetical protein
VFLFLVLFLFCFVLFCFVLFCFVCFYFFLFYFFICVSSLSPSPSCFAGPGDVKASCVLAQASGSFIFALSWEEAEAGALYIHVPAGFYSVTKKLEDNQQT